MMIGSFRASFLHCSMKTPPFPLLYRKRGLMGSFLTSCKDTLQKQCVLFCQDTRSLAPPLGELSCGTHDREGILNICLANIQYIMVFFEKILTLSDPLHTGHLSQRERQGISLTTAKAALQKQRGLVFYSVTGAVVSSGAVVSAGTSISGTAYSFCTS